MPLSESEIQIKLHELMEGSLIAVLWIFLAIWIVRQKKLFIPLSLNNYSPIQLSDVLACFGIFLFFPIFSSAFLLPLFQMFTMIMNHNVNFFDTHVTMKFNLFILFCSYACLIFYYLKCLNAEKKEAIFGLNSFKYKNYLKGASSWFLIYPFVLLCVALINAAIVLVFHQAPIEQDVIALFRAIISDPFLAIVLGFVISVVVPVVEEFLFRGLLQSWLKKKLNSPYKAIIGAGVIFSLFHYSSSQGLTNISLLVSLFLLGCFLGYLYEKYQSLWASIGLHSTFNALTAIFILLGSE